MCTHSYTDPIQKLLLCASSGAQRCACRRLTGLSERMQAAHGGGDQVSGEHHLRGFDDPAGHHRVSLCGAWNEHASGYREDSDARGQIKLQQYLCARRALGSALLV